MTKSPSVKKAFDLEGNWEDTDPRGPEGPVRMTVEVWQRQVDCAPLEMNIFPPQSPKTGHWNHLSPWLSHKRNIYIRFQMSLNHFQAYLMGIPHLPPPTTIKWRYQWGRNSQGPVGHSPGAPRPFFLYFQSNIQIHGNLIKRSTSWMCFTLIVSRVIC